MSDNHEKFQNGFDPNNGSEPVNTNTSANNAVNSTNAYGTYHNAQYPTNNTPAYTWNAQSAPQQNAPVQPNGQPVYYGVPVHQPQKQPKPKKHGSKFGLKLLAVVLCCAITSAASLGVFVVMIQNGVINVQSSEASSNAAFTISRVVNGDTSSDTSASSDGTVSAMSDQDIAAKLTPSVVCIQNYQVTQKYGFMQTDTSDSACIELPMVVLVNRDSYSAAEFFAAALQEYDWAKVVGEKTCGKGNFQTGFPLSDGSYLNISIGKYYTPQGRSLTDIGVTPDEEIEYDDETYAKLYYGQLPDEEDTQLQAAIGILTDEIS